jgi:hypothetical protein
MLYRLKGVIELNKRCQLNLILFLLEMIIFILMLISNKRVEIIIEKNLKRNIQVIANQ